MWRLVFQSHIFLLSLSFLPESYYGFLGGVRHDTMVRQEFSEVIPFCFADTSEIQLKNSKLRSSVLMRTVEQFNCLHVMAKRSRKQTNRQLFQLFSVNRVTVNVQYFTTDMNYSCPIFQSPFFGLSTTRLIVNRIFMDFFSISTLFFVTCLLLTTHVETIQKKSDTTMQR